MKIGVVKEIKSDEYRVALTPAGARELVARGHEVVVELEAGAGSAFTDSEYVAAGASVALVGVQAAGACAFADAVRSGSVVAGGAATIADGIAVRQPAARTVAIARANGTTMRIVTQSRSVATLSPGSLPLLGWTHRVIPRRGQPAPASRSAHGRRPVCVAGSSGEAAGR